MRLTSFRIKNFRSILDTGIVRFSPDNVTVLVGQNESGKTAVLEALSKTLSSDEVVIDDVRHDEPLPEIWISTQWTEVEIADLCKQITNEVCRAPVAKAFKENNFVVNWIFKNTKSSNEKSGLDSSYEIDNLDLRDHISTKLNLTKTIESVANAVMQLANPQTGEEITPVVDVEKLITTTLEKWKMLFGKDHLNLFCLMSNLVYFLIVLKSLMSSSFSVDRALRQQATFSP